MSVCVTIIFSMMLVVYYVLCYMQPCTNRPTPPPFHISIRQRKFREFYENRDIATHPHSLENIIEPLRRVRKKLPISGDYGLKRIDGHINKTDREALRSKSSLQQLTLLPSQPDHQNSHVLPYYLKLKQIKRKNSLDYDGPAYVKETDEQLQQRARQFFKCLEERKNKRRRSSLLNKGEYQQRLLDSQILECEKTIIENQRLMQRQARVEQRIKYLRKSQLCRDRYQLEQNEGGQHSRNSVRLQSKLSINLQQIQRKHRLSLNLSQNSQRSQDICSPERAVTQPDECLNSLQNESKNMLKKLISLVKKKERLTYLSTIGTPQQPS